VNGMLACQGGVGPKPEVCNGIDDNCNGQVDEAPLADAPPAGQNGCWNDPPTSAMPGTFHNLSWCPPMGATANANGTLTAPGTKGTLACAGAAGWVCQGAKEPSPEVCDGLDNNCNGQVDENVTGIGQPCGSNVGECKQGVTSCAGGVIVCMGAVG